MCVCLFEESHKHICKYCLIYRCASSRVFVLFDRQHRRRNTACRIAFARANLTSHTQQAHHIYIVHTHKMPWHLISISTVMFAGGWGGWRTEDLVLLSVYVRIINILRCVSSSPPCTTYVVYTICSSLEYVCHAQFESRLLRILLHLGRRSLSNIHTELSVWRFVRNRSKMSSRNPHDAHDASRVVSMCC